MCWDGPMSAGEPTMRGLKGSKEGKLAGCGGGGCTTLLPCSQQLQCSGLVHAEG